MVEHHYRGLQEVVMRQLWNSFWLRIASTSTRRILSNIWSDTPVMGSRKGHEAVVRLLLANSGVGLAQGIANKVGFHL